MAEASDSKGEAECDGVLESLEAENDIVVDINAPFPTDNQRRAVEVFKDLWNARANERRAFRESNLKVDYETFEKLVKGRKLDSSLKKCTAFMKKMKQYVESQKSSIEADLDVLNLTRYQSEIAAVIVDGRLKLSDISGIVSVCSAVHKRYQEFAGSLVESFRNVLPTKKTEVVPSVISKVSSDIRLLAELLLGGIIPEQEGFPLLLSCIETMTFLDKEGALFLIPFITLLRGLGDDIIGVIPFDTRETLKANGILLSHLIRSDALGFGRKKELQVALSLYFDAVKANIVKKHEELLKYEKYNRKLLMSKGEVPSDRIQKFRALQSKFDKYHSNAIKLGYLLDKRLPKLRQLPPDSDDEIEKALLTTEDGEILKEVPGIVVFDNEETRQFYQDYPDLRVYLPPVGRRDSMLQIQEKTIKLEEVEKLLGDFDTESEEETTEEGISADNSILSSVQLEKEESEAVPELKGGGIHPQRQAFLDYLANLPNCVSKSMIDKAAIDFAQRFNNKRRRKELVRKLFEVPRLRVDLLPLYSRLVASLSRVFPDIGTGLCALLQKDFRYLVFQKDQIKIETKLKVTRFIAELVNFSVLPKSDAFDCLRMLLRHFVHHQVEMACAFLETCGRFLYRTSDSHRRMKIYLEVMLRKKTVCNLEPRYLYMLDCAYFHICPPSGSAIQRIKKEPMVAFLEYVLWIDLNKNQSLERAYTCLKSLDWSVDQNSANVLRILSSPWKFNFPQMDAAAALLALIRNFRPSCTIAVVENLTEQIRLGCDYPFDDLNNCRMATCQYLAYIYTYKVISTTTLFNIWYYLISYGVTYQDANFTRMDPPDNTYRVRMICQMLRVCGDYLSSSDSAKCRLNFFLKYFQRYFVYKRNLSHWDTNEFPYFVEEYYEETFRRVRSKWTLAKTMEEAEKDIQEMDEALRKQVTNEEIKYTIYSQTQCVRLPPNAKRDFKKLSRGSSHVANTLTDIAEEDGENLNEQKGTIVTDDGDGVNHEPIEGDDQLKNLEEEEFLAAFDQMCTEANQAAMKSSKMNLPIPMSTTSKVDELDGNQTVNVTLLTKKNNKQKLRTLPVPAEEDFIVSLKTREEAEVLDKQRVKSRTLAIARMQQEEERRQEEQSLFQLFFKKSTIRRK